MQISNLPNYTGTWPNASTQTDEDYANNTFFAHAWIGTTMTPALNIIIPQFNSAIESVTADKEAVLEAKNITLAARDEASISATAATNAKLAAEAALDIFDDRYLGTKSADPLVDNDGNPLTMGAMYYYINTDPTLNKQKVYNSELAIWTNMSFVPTAHSGLSGIGTKSHDQLESELALKFLKSGGSLTGAINTAKATVASSATTSQIWTALGNQIDWTGTATTTAFPNSPQAGAERTLICAGACSFTAGANMLIDGVASGATVTCAASDTVIVRAISTTQFKLTRLKADGTAQVSAGGGAWTLLSSVNASNSATVDIESTFNSTYDNYIILVSGMTSSAGSEVFCRLKINGVYQTGANYSFHTSFLVSGDALYSAARSSTATSIKLGGNLNTNTLDNANLKMSIANPENISFYKHIRWDYSVNSGTEITNSIGAGLCSSGAQALTGIRFFLSAGNIVAGRFDLYGIKNT